MSTWDRLHQLTASLRSKTNRKYAAETVYSLKLWRALAILVSKTETEVLDKEQLKTRREEVVSLFQCVLGQIIESVVHIEVGVGNPKQTAKASRIQRHTNFRHQPENGRSSLCGCSFVVGVTSIELERGTPHKLRGGFGVTGASADG